MNVLKIAVSDALRLQAQGLIPLSGPVLYVARPRFKTLNKARSLRWLIQARKWA
ncbi:hypothetical protein D3C86_1007630 [compost metagenome]